jgi:hypothetical protein
MRRYRECRQPVPGDRPMRPRRPRGCFPAGATLSAARTSPSSRGQDIALSRRKPGFDSRWGRQGSCGFPLPRQEASVDRPEMVAPVARLTPQMLAAFRRERDVVSYAPGLDETGRALVLKFVLKNGGAHVVFLPPLVAFHIRASIRDASRKHRYRDVRRRVGEARPEPQIIKDFLDGQPEICGDDWDALGGEVPRIAQGCEVHAFRDAVFLAFMVSGDTFQVFRVHPAISFYLPEMIDEAEQTGVLIDLEKAVPPSRHRQ